MNPITRTITGDEVIDREMNTAEFTQYQADQTAAALIATKLSQDETALRAARLAAITKLKALGLTDNEIKAIVRQ